MNNYKPLEKKIPCNGIRPTTSEVYTLAAELQDIHEFKTFKEAIMSALMSYDYAYYAYQYYYYYYEYYDCYSYDYYDYDHYDYDYGSKEEKVMTLLFIAAINTH